MESSNNRPKASPEQIADAQASFQTFVNILAEYMRTLNNAIERMDTDIRENARLTVDLIEVMRRLVDEQVKAARPVHCPACGADQVDWANCPTCGDGPARDREPNKPVWPSPFGPRP